MNNFFELTKKHADLVDYIIRKQLEKVGCSDCKTKEELEARGFKIEAEHTPLSLEGSDTHYKMIELSSGKELFRSTITMKGIGEFSSVE